MPYIAVHFWDVWDAPISQGMDPRQLTPTVLDLVKNKMINLMVCMFLLPSSMVQSIATRRSRRNMVISAINDDNEILSVPSRKRSRVDAEVDVSDDDSGLGDVPPSTNTVMNLFNLGSLKELWNNGNYFEVGR